MRIVVRLDSRSVREFHLALLERLAKLADVNVSVDARPASSRVPGSVEALFRLETAMHGLRRDGMARRVPVSSLSTHQTRQTSSADLVLDLCGDVGEAEARVWRLTYGGACGEEALLALILDGQTPLARIEENANVIAEGRLGTEYHGIAIAAFQDMLARTVSLVAAAVTSASNSRAPALPEVANSGVRPAIPSAGRLGIRATTALARRVVQKVYHSCYNAPHWKVGWRKTGAVDLFDLRAHPRTGWQVLPDDGSRFYADPFPILHKGRVTLFVEDYVHRTGKAIISAVQFGADGPMGSPEPVLERPYHLSYPFVFERDGEMWMVPESCANGTVDLYRATAFPSGWVKETTLISDVVASDATLVEHGGSWWMFATVRDGGGAFSDALHLWSAPDFRGPWSPHPANPVLIDVASARPAGRMIERDGQLLRPVQDCRKSYGAALGIARVTRLDPRGMEQTVETILTSGEQWSGRKLHTLNAAGGFEFIDGSAIAPRWKQRGRHRATTNGPHHASPELAAGAGPQDKLRIVSREA